MVFRIALIAPPAGVDIGLQKGKGSAYETVQKQRSGGSDLHFEFEADVKNGEPAGPFVQGPRGGRFIYLDIGTAAGQHDTCWSRRLKIPLVDFGAADPPAVFATRVAGTGRDGGPACGTVKPFEGWTSLTT